MLIKVSCAIMYINSKCLLVWWEGCFHDTIHKRVSPNKHYKSVSCTIGVLVCHMCTLLYVPR